MSGHGGFSLESGTRKEEAWVCANHTFQESNNTEAGDHASEREQARGAAEMAPGAGDAAQWEASCFFSLDGGGEVINDGMD